MARILPQWQHSAGQLAQGGGGVVKSQPLPQPGAPPLLCAHCLSHIVSLRPGAQAFWSSSPVSPSQAFLSPACFESLLTGLVLSLLTFLSPRTAARGQAGHCSQSLKSPSSFTHRRKSLCSNWVVPFFLI